LVSRVDLATLEAMVDRGELSGGMIPKIDGCISAVRGGVRGAHILDGRRPHVVLLELLTDEGVGTMITATTDAEARAS
jgi:acetylglutamate kinase